MPCDTCLCDSCLDQQGADDKTSERGHDGTQKLVMNDEKEGLWSVCYEEDM